MGTIVATEFITLDGVIDDPGGQRGGRGGWAFTYDRGDAGNQFKFAELMAADAQLLGRVTYEGFAEAWPKMNQDEFGQKMNSMPKYVVSSTLTDPSWENTTVISGELEREVSALKDRHANVLIAGSGQLVRSLLALDLIDELRLMVYPIVLGGGTRLFGESERSHRLRLATVGQAGETATFVLTR
jgi:dihydrofolate reductase